MIYLQMDILIFYKGYLFLCPNFIWNANFLYIVIIIVKFYKLMLEVF